MALSNSGIKTYQECPYKYKLTRIEHRQEPAGPAADRGKNIHYAFEQALEALPMLPPEHSGWYSYIEELSKLKAKSEVEFAFTHDWQACGFKDDNAWIRGIFDVIYFVDDKAHVLDWKTGKERDYSDQLKLYALAILTCYPHVNSVTTEICFIDLNKQAQGVTYLRSQFTDLQSWLNNKIGRAHV